MNRTHRSLFWTIGLLGLTFLSFERAPTTADEDGGRNEQPHLFAKLERGMSPEQVRQLVGKPKRIARQILYHRYYEQWIYDAPVPIRLTFDCPRGQMPQLLTVPALPVEKPR